MAATPEKMASRAEYTPAEDLANSLTHGLGAALSVAALAILVTQAALHGDVWRVVSFGVYGSSLVVLYLASTLYHAFRSPRLKRFFKGLDHAAIFLLIAGTYTPFSLVTLRGPWGWTIFGLIWGFAVAGIIFETLFLGRFKRLVVVFYLGMGWMAVIAIKPLIEALPVAGLVWVAAGGLFYTLGVIFYLWEKLTFNHAIWHLFVLGGSVCHFFAIALHVLPMK